jgi:xanthine dehydrogenase large subunit
MRNIDIKGHVRGESLYLDDFPLLGGTLFAAAYGSPHAHARIKGLHLDRAKKMPGVIRILTAADIPGANQIGGIVPDEPLLAEGEVHFQGMPVALVLAKSQEEAQAALEVIEIELDPLPIVTDPRLAWEKGNLIVPPRTFRMGDTESAWTDCKWIFRGKAETNGQEHLYIETQGAYAFPSEDGGIKILSSTQGPTAVQRHVAHVLGIPMHQVEVDVTRLGGGFGGKEDQATLWAALCALAAFVVKRPVKYSLNRMEDMRMTGKRHPYSTDYVLGLGQDLSILAFEADFFQNAGASADLSPAVLERTLFHCTNAYSIPNVRATAYSCRTNLPPNTAFRGFGGPQGMFVIEAAIHHAAKELQIPAWEIQKKNLLKDGDEFPYGQKAVSEALACWENAWTRFSVPDKIREIEAYNQQEIRYKKGISLMPICFGISFTKTPMNQARALVHVYGDGSVGISTGAVEMGQGVNTKIAQVASLVFGLELGNIKVHTTNTFRIANTSPSAASATADLNGKATEMACFAIRERLFDLASQISGAPRNSLKLRNGMLWSENSPTPISWEKLIQEAWLNRISLSEHAHYAPPGLFYDAKTEKGHPFAYHVYGVACTEVLVDCLRGTSSVEAVSIVHDVGKTMNEDIDLGQIEGGLVQGIGWMTMEEIVYDNQGKLRSNALSTYKIPDVYSVPGQVDIHFLNTERDNLAILQSKAVGEPPLMYGIGTYFALANAISAFNPQTRFPYSAPFTPEKVLMALYPDAEKKQ